MRRTVLVLVLTLAASPPARSADDPAVWLRQAYDLYHRSEKQPELLKDSAETLAAHHASRAFAARIQRDLVCEKNSSEICAIDWDFIVNGQAWELSKVQVGALAVSGARATVAVTFVNMKTTNRNIYEFVREDGAWKLDDVVSGQSGQAPIRISKVLRDFRS